MLNKKLIIFSASIMAFSLTGCETLNSSLESINSVLGSTSTSSNSHSVSIPDSLTTSIQSSIQKSIKNENASIRSMVVDASPRISEVTGKLACGVDYSTLGRYSTTNSKPHPFLPPKRDMSYHTGGCLDVYRVHSWKKLAANSLGFSVDYISPSSEEVVKRNYIIIKQPDGEWLYNWNAI